MLTLCTVFWYRIKKYTLKQKRMRCVFNSDSIRVIVKKFYIFVEDILLICKWVFLHQSDTDIENFVTFKELGWT